MPVPGTGTDCICGAARTVSGLGSSAGYCSSVSMTGFPAPGSTDLSSCSLPPPSAHKGAHCIALGGALVRGMATPRRPNEPGLQGPRRPPNLNLRHPLIVELPSQHKGRVSRTVGSYGAWRAVPRPDGAEVCTEQFGAVMGCRLRTRGGARV